MAEYFAEPECLALDPGAASLRFAYIDDRRRPQPAIVTSKFYDRHYSTLVAMESPPIFLKKAHFSDPKVIVADAFRAKSNHVEEISFFVKRGNDSYQIPLEDKRFLNQNFQNFSQIDIMSMMLKDISDITDNDLKRKGLYVCVPDASDINHRRKLRKALELASQKRQHEADERIMKKLSSSRNIKEEIEPILFIQQSAAVAQMAFHLIPKDLHWISGNIMSNDKKRRIPPRRIIVAITFGAGHFSAGAYEQQFFERYGIIKLCDFSDDKLGGEDLNQKLAEWCLNHKDINKYADELKKNQRLLKFFRDTMEEIKINLSTRREKRVDIKVEENKVVNIEISQNDFNLACSEVFDKIKEHLEKISEYLKNRNLVCTDVIYAGGSTRIANFQKIVSYVFPEARIIKSINPDECQVLGTGLKAGIRDGIHRMAYAECQDTAMDTRYIAINGIQFYLTKKRESVQNSPERYIKALTEFNMIPYPDDDNNNLEKKTKELRWTPDVECDVRRMIRDYPIGNQHSLTDFVYRPETNVIGINLGTTNIICALHRAGDTKSEVLTFSDGKRIMPSVVEFDEIGNYKCCGSQAVENQKMNAGYVLYDAKMMIGQAYSNRLKLHDAYWPFEVKPNQDRRPVYVLSNIYGILPERVSMELLRVIKKTAQQRLGSEEVRDCVITVPAYFSMEQKQATQEAARDAGLNVLSLMTEPVAAACAYSFDHPQDNEFTLLVFNLEGGTFDVTIIKYENGQFVTKCTDGDNNLGGRDFDNALFEYVKQRIHTVSFEGPQSFKNRIKLMEKCEEIKADLNQYGKVIFKLKDFGDDSEIEITQRIFREQTKGLMDSISYICNRAVKNACIESCDIDKVLLIGGASRMKIIKDLVRDIFPNQMQDEKGGASADEAVAVGAAIRAAQLRDPKHKNIKNYIDALPIGVGIGLIENQYSIMVNRGTHFPTTVVKQYFTSRNNQEVVHIVIYEGERLLADRNRKLGEFYLTGLPKGPAGQVSIDVTFKFDQNGILTVLASSKSGSQESFTINYKEQRDQGEPIEDLIRQFESCRIDDEGKQLRNNAWNELMENIEEIRFLLDNRIPDKDKGRLIEIFDKTIDVINKENNVFIITKMIRILEDEIKKVLYN